jgi:hypothetical protein
MNKLVAIGLLLASVAVASSACVVVPLGGYPGPGVYAPGPVIVAPSVGWGWQRRGGYYGRGRW